MSSKAPQPALFQRLAGPGAEGANRARGTGGLPRLAPHAAVGGQEVGEERPPGPGNHFTELRVNFLGVLGLGQAAVILGSGPRFQEPSISWLVAGPGSDLRTSCSM